MPPSKYTPDEIRKSMLLPLIKKALMEGIGDRGLNQSLLYVFAPDENISALPPKFLNKIESSSNEKES